MCDTWVSLTDDGVLFAKNSDRDVNEAQQVWWYAGQSRPEPTVRVTHTEIAQADRTYAVAVSRPWWMWGAEMGANEHGVVIGNEAVFTRGRASDGLLLGMDLLRLALDRASTRTEAAEVIVSLLESWGQGGPCSYEDPRFTYDNSFLVADPAGAIVLETAGRSWATEEVTGRGRSISNGLTIPAFARAFEPSGVTVCASRRPPTVQPTSDWRYFPTALVVIVRPRSTGSVRDSSDCHIGAVGSAISVAAATNALAVIPRRSHGPDWATHIW